MPSTGSLDSVRRSLRSIVAVGVALPLALSATAAASTGGQAMFGIAAGGAIQDQDATSRDRDLDVMRDVGAKWVRIDINWAQIQRNGPSSYGWEDIDEVVRGATARGMNVLGVITSTPGWARPAGTTSRHGPDPQQYATFAAAAAEHYSALGVHAFEIWNEPNVDTFWQPAPDPEHYARVLTAAYQAIKAADPQAVVLTGGTAPATTTGARIAPIDFLTGIYANGAGGYFDAVGHHPYGWPAYPGETQSWNAWHQTAGTSPSLRSVMVANGDGHKTIWATEYGAPTNGPAGSHVSESDQARMISEAYELWASYSWAGPLFTYQARDLGTSPDTRENFFGLLRNDYSQKPAYAAYKAAVDSAAETADGTGNTSGSDTSTPGEGEPILTHIDGTGADGDDKTTRDEADPLLTRIKVKVRGKGVAKGARAAVRGRVWTRRGTPRTATAARVTLRGKVRLRLYRKGRRAGVWRPASRIRTSKVSRRGRFKRSLRRIGRRKLRRGVYRVRVRYRGSRHVQSARSWSPRFRLAATSR